MNIFYASEHKYRIQWNSRLWYYNHYLPLKDLGHRLIPFDYNITPHRQRADPTNPKHLPFIEKNRGRLEEELLKQVKEAHRKYGINVFFSYFWAALCQPAVIEEIKALGIITINWFCNAAHQFHLVRDLAPAFDYCLVPEKFRIKDYEKIGAKPIYFPEAANPSIYKPYNLSRQHDVTFVGQRYGDRWDTIAYLHQNNIPVHVWGDGWRPATYLVKMFNYSPVYLAKMAFQKGRHLISNGSKDKNSIPKKFRHGVLSDEEYVKMYSRSIISLGFSACGDTHREKERILQVRLRDIEAPMSGAFYMVEYMEELEEHFEIGREIVCFKNKEDLTDKIKYYLANDNAREKIRQAGYKRALADHTCQERFRKLFLKIGKDTGNKWS